MIFFAALTMVIGALMRVRYEAIFCGLDAFQFGIVCRYVGHSGSTF
jgi:hypothetical protein